ncbi:MAG TPA: GNAT family N-acetyltransferase [Arthrobacter bacterium]|jgi:GNAT superfamily N-acetyltransferase|nr:GNAT family N-acetyltransferase [Arthrobacter sp.]HAP90915.1 GNAT family N-acetyltransferase [Arthrobacter sp.]HBH59442.1 GNAT family N-acetyltransferase [Arthrobacter sp.]HCB57842.1 GNAT family N-acetyltransferase [Arthrobacter sp.]HCC40897.1 GNAT family N-acetyltransferase [Arthrobacter sp.]
MISTTDILAAYDSQLRRLIPPAVPSGHEYQLLGPLLRVTGQRRGFIESARDLGVDGGMLDRLIAEQRDYFASRGEAVEWKTRAHDLPIGLETRLGAAGFVPEARETVLVGESAAMAGEPAVPEGVRLTQVRERPDLERLAAMKSEVWGADYSWVAPDLHHRLASDPENLVVLMAEASGVVVSAAWLEINPGTDFAGLWGGSTLPAWRGRGIYKALVSARAQVAAARGVKYLQVDASTDSEPILRRLGFRAITTTTPFVWTPPARGDDRRAPG